VTRRSRWTSFVADPDDERATRRYAGAQGRHRIDAAEEAYGRLYAGRR
jgi:hypothetical protein